MSPNWNDITTIRNWINARKTRIDELEKMLPTAENLAEVRRIKVEANDLERTLKSIKGNMYPYAN